MTLRVKSGGSSSNNLFILKILINNVQLPFRVVCKSPVIKQNTISECHDFIIPSQEDEHCAFREGNTSSLWYREEEGWPLRQMVHYVLLCQHEYLYYKSLNFYYCVLFLCCLILICIYHRCQGSSQDIITAVGRGQLGPVLYLGRHLIVHGGYFP